MTNNIHLNIAHTEHDGGLRPLRINAVFRSPELLFTLDLQRDPGTSYQEGRWSLHATPHLMEGPIPLREHLIYLPAHLLGIILLDPKVLPSIHEIDISVRSELFSWSCVKLADGCTASARYAGKTLDIASYRGDNFAATALLAESRAALIAYYDTHLRQPSLLSADRVYGP